MSTTVVISTPATETATIAPPAAATPAISGGTSAAVTLSHPAPMTVTVNEPTGPAPISVTAVPALTVAPVTPPAVSVAMTTPTPATATIAQPGTISPTITGQGVQGIPGNLAALHEYWLNDYGGGANKTAAQNDAAFDAILAAGGASTGSWYANINEGGVIRFAGPCQFSKVWAIPKHWGIQGLSMTLSALNPTNPTDQITWSTRTGSGYRFAHSGDFTFDGLGITNVPALFFGKLSDSAVSRVNVVNVNGIGILLEATQNVVFTSVNVEGCGASALVLDYGAAGNVFIRCEINGFNSWGIEILGTGGYPGTSTPPASNTFIACIIEVPNPAGALGLIHGGAGLRNRFVGCTFAWGNAPAGTVAPLVLLENLGSLSHFHTEFQSCSWAGSASGLLSALNVTGTVSAILDDGNVFSGFSATPIAIGPSVTLTSGELRGIAAIPQGNNVGFPLPTTLRITRNSAADTAFEVWEAGEAHPRLRLMGDGTFSLGNGSITPDISFQRSGGALGARFRVSQVMSAGIGTAGTGLRVGDGDLIRKDLSATATWDAPSVADGAMTSTTVTVTGAAVGDVVSVGHSTAVPAGALLVGAVTAADTVTVTLFNKTGGALDLASGTLRVLVWQF